MTEIAKTEMMLKAVNTMVLEWSGKLAVDRIYIFIYCYVNNTSFVPYESGPLSLDK